MAGQENTYTTSNNRTLAAVSNSDGSTHVNLYANPTTHALLVSNAGSTGPAGADNFGTNQVALSIAATLISAARVGRQSITVVNLSAIDIYIGNSNTVTTSTGQLLLGIRGTAMTLNIVGAVYGIAATGTPSVSYEEEY